MNYYQIDRTTEAKIIGIKNGTSQVELDVNSIEKDDKYLDFEKHFSGFKKDFWSKQSDIFSLNTPLLKGKLRKGARITDIMRYGPTYRYLFKMYSEKYIDIIKAFRLGNFKTFEFNIENVNEMYYLLFFESVTLDEIVYDKSTIISGHKVLKNLNYHIIKNSTEYIEFNSQFPTGGFEKLTIPKKYSERDIIQTQASSLPFYSERLIDFLLDSNITGLQIGYKNSILLEFD